MAETRIVVLTHGGNRLSAYFPSLQDAADYIAQWVEHEFLRNKREPCEHLDYWAVNAKFVIGMYIANDQPTAQERMAAAAEKIARGECPGDEWKDK